ncbi:MAG: FMN-binding negative transcriptional regulator, partial [Psychroserpens sp.]|nr:FMN-binding negative transcriptional regulator [Psychroserpens sp.]
MYIPKHYNGKDKQESIAFMKRFNFGTIITSIDNIPFAT